MNSLNLLKNKKNIYSQNGEDGVIEEIFKQLNITNGSCCEFGAWDGIHFSNTRNLILNGWTSIQIEYDPKKFELLKKTYENNKKVYRINTYIDDGDNSIEKTFLKNGLENYIALDFLSIDVDGLDYWIMEKMGIKPNVICIEVNAAHNPLEEKMIPREISKNNIGQSLKVFTNLAEKMGYALVCYTGNAFFIKKDILEKTQIPILDTVTAYENFLFTLSKEEKERLFFVNLGMINTPSYKFNNPFLSRNNLNLSILIIIYNVVILILRKIISVINPKK
jgi:hypothetical protein